jgi:transcriptional repressor of dcmA and dcmR
MSEDQLLDIKQAADFLQVSETSLRRWTNSGRLACLRVGHRRERRFRRADLLAFAEQQPGVPPRAGVAWRVAGSGAHLLGVYGTDRGRADLATSFLADGFREGRACFLLAPRVVQGDIWSQLRERHPVARAELDRSGLQMSEYLGSIEEQIQYLESCFHDALRNGATSLCVVGDVLSLKESITMDGLAEYEAHYDARIARRYPVMTLCQYDARGFSSSEMLDGLKVHPDNFRYPTDSFLS